MRPSLVLLFGIAYLTLLGSGAACADERPQPAVLTDLYGDPLPAGAVVRLGSMRLRHAGLSSDFVLLPDSRTALTAGSDRTLRWWDLTTGRPLKTLRLQGTAGPVSLVTQSPDGKTLVALAEQQLVFWEVATGKQIKTLPAPEAGLHYLYFSPDGKTLAVGRRDGRVSFWDWQAGKEREIALAYRPRPGVPFNTDITFHGSFSPDSQWFVAGAAWGEPLGIFEVASGREVRRLECHAITSVVAPDGRHLAVSSIEDGQGQLATVLRLLQLPEGKEVAQFPLDKKAGFYSLAFSPDGKSLACGSSERSCVLDCATGRVLYRLPECPLTPRFTADGKTLVSSTGTRLRVWDAATGQERYDYPGEFGAMVATALSPQGRLLAAANWSDQTISLWDTASGRRQRLLPLQGKKRYVRSLVFSPDGQTLFAGQSWGFLQSWQVTTGMVQQTSQLCDSTRPDPEDIFFSQLRLSTDGQRVFTLERVGDKGPSMRLALWQANSGKLVHQHYLPRHARDGGWLADGSAVALRLKEGLTLLDVKTGTPRFRLAPTERADPLAISPDDRLLAVTNRAAGTVGVWEVLTGQKVATVATGQVSHLALAADNRCLVTTDQSCLRVWDLATGKERYRRPLPAGVNASTLLLALDGRRALTTLTDGTALIWDLTPAPGLDGPLVREAGAEEIAAWWSDLADADAGRAYAALWRLAEGPEAAVIAFLRTQLRPVTEADFREVRQLIAELASESFAAREKAYQRLEGLGSVAEPALRQALTKDLPLEERRRLEKLLARPLNLAGATEVLRRLRAVQVLERLATPEARRLLTALAGGMAQAIETREAQAALERLSRSGARP